MGVYKFAYSCIFVDLGIFNEGKCIEMLLGHFNHLLRKKMSTIYIIFCSYTDDKDPFLLELKLKVCNSCS